MPPPPPPPTPENWVKLCNIGAGQCSAVTRTIPVAYTNATTSNATLSVSCSCAAMITPSPQTVTPGTGTINFTVKHAGVGAGHRIRALLANTTITLAGDEVLVHVANPCPIVVQPPPAVDGELPYLDREDPVCGTFDATKGNGIILLVDDPGKIVDGKPPRPQLVFADPAVVQINGGQGTFKHEVIPGARKGQQVRIVLTKDGVVASIIRAVFA